MTSAEPAPRAPAYLPDPADPRPATLASVLPAIARSLGSSAYAEVPDLGLPPAGRAVVVLVDGLGYEQLRRRGGHAPYLRSRLDDAMRLDSGFPSTTATSMGTFGTGLPPGQHGLVGYEVLVPEADRILNELSWEHGPDPFAWQPAPTVFERLVAEGVEVTRVGPGFFDGSGLTNAALRGGGFAAARTLAERVDAAVQAVRAAPRSLVYLYWGDLDKVGHVNGVDSFEWGEELASVDAWLARLVGRMPSDAAVYVTADHGMVDVPYRSRLDLAAEPELLAGVRHVGGEPRAPQIYCEPGAAADVAARWGARLGSRAWVAPREEIVDAGWFGRVREEVLPRIGDVVVPMLEAYAVVDSVRMRPELLRLLGVHGSVSWAERAVPLVVFGPGAD